MKSINGIGAAALATAGLLFVMQPAFGAEAGVNAGVNAGKTGAGAGAAVGVDTGDTGSTATASSDAAKKHHRRHHRHHRLKGPRALLGRGRAQAWGRAPEWERTRRSNGSLERRRKGERSQRPLPFVFV